MDRRRLTLALALAAPLGLGACGFQPLYAVTGVTAGLESVDVHVPQNRAGFLLHEQLDDELSRDRDAPARYRLNLRLDEKRYPRGLRVNNVASDFELDMRVDYDLIDASNSKKLISGSAPVTVFYVSADAPYAGIAAQQDAQERAASQAAIQIRLDLSRYFARQAGKAAAAGAAPVAVK